MELSTMLATFSTLFCLTKCKVNYLQYTDFLESLNHIVCHVIYWPNVIRENTPGNQGLRTEDREVSTFHSPSPAPSLPSSNRIHKGLLTRFIISPEPVVFLSNLTQARVIPNDCNLLSQIIERRKTVPASKQVIGRRAQQAAGLHRWLPFFFADLFNGIPVGQQPEIPCPTQTCEKIHLLGQRIERIRNLYIRV